MSLDPCSMIALQQVALQQIALQQKGRSPRLLIFGGNANRIFQNLPDYN